MAAIPPGFAALFAASCTVYLPPAGFQAQVLWAPTWPGFLGPMKTFGEACVPWVFFGGSIFFFFSPPKTPKGRH